MSTTPEPDQVVVRGGGSGLATEVRVGPHRLVADEPADAGGTETGPSPYDLLLAALGACTSMTLGLYARRKGWPLEATTVRLRHAKVHPADGAAGETPERTIDRIEGAIELAGPLTEAPRARLLESAQRCPVHRTLTSEIDIRTRLVQ